ncbi:C-type lectin mannose-binding isoform-like [Neocloeon triangulifer]|uniref:C-type lectin mannose-binding isoform-like n=1 Tax=Neocloeon triangulifer TaxID=2078957 RepID=UPI00286ED633|nr:C-type lectin mannose-binding isoform-like [Neocloeon triangulifer]
MKVYGVLAVLAITLTTLVQADDYSNDPSSAEVAVALSRISHGKLYISAEKKNWQDANRSCEMQKMELASIKTEAAEMEIRTAIADNQEVFWISGTDFGSRGIFDWEWIDRALKSDIKEEPKNTTTIQCTNLWYTEERGLLWKDSPCHLLYRFICELGQLD